MIEDSLGLASLDPAFEQRGLREHVYDNILQLLLSGKMAHGARLSIDTVARQLGISPTPVREAFVQLERTGLVTREARKGYRVAPPLDAEQLAELFDARLMLETTAARFAAVKGESLLDELLEAQEQHRLAGERMIEALDDGGSSVELATDYFGKDSDFHRVILRHCGNRYIYEMSESLGAQLHRMRQSVHKGVTDVSEAIAEHEAIVAAFRGGDPEVVESAMRHHLTQVRNRSIAEESRSDKA